MWLNQYEIKSDCTTDRFIWNMATIRMSKVQQNESVCAVVVTYNRERLLLLCLRSLLHQNRPLDAIVIIDNLSSFATPNLLFKNSFIKQIPSKTFDKSWEQNRITQESMNGHQVHICYVRMEYNSGGAGGFHEGVKRAYEAGFHWLWLMDDDVSPTNEALETMLQYSSISRCIHPSKRYEDGSIFPWGGHLDARRMRLHYDRYPFSDSSVDFVDINFGCFEGMLIHRSVVDQIGYPDSRFFITGDDLIYGYLASKVTRNIYIRHICFVKYQPYKNVAGRISTRPSPVSMYYDIRNRFLVFNYVKQQEKVLFTAYIFIFLYFVRRVIAIFVYDRQKLIRLRYVVRGLKDGIRKKWGKLIE